eukprot:c24260_g1_i1 orf=84-1241(+)
MPSVASVATRRLLQPACRHRQTVLFLEQYRSLATASRCVHGFTSSTALSTHMKQEGLLAAMVRGVPQGYQYRRGVYGYQRFHSTIANSSSQEAAARTPAQQESQLGSAGGSPATSPGDMVKEELQDASRSGDLAVSNYWGIAPKSIVRRDGTVWPWRSFMPWEAYTSDTTIDLKRHHVPDTFVDKVAYWTVKLLRVPTDIFFQKRYGCRAMMLETVAAVPGMVGGMLLHLQSLRKFEHSGGWIRALLEEAENERMHLMTFMEVAKPHWYERALVFAVQGIFFNVYFLVYLVSPRLAHRITGYLEEEAIYSYTQYLHEIDCGRLPNMPAPAIAIDYWRLSKDATIRDVVVVVRADEAHHRDVNHFAADIHEQGKPLKEAPAPVGYH